MTRTYLFDRSNRTSIMSIQRQANAIINSFFTKSQSLVGKPLFTVNSDKVIVQLFYYTSSTNNSEGLTLSNLSVVALGEALTHC